MKRFIENFLMVFLILIFLVAAIQLYNIWEEYHEAEEEYQALQQFVKESEEKNKKKRAENPEGKEKSERVIDFENLKKINPDIVAWIRIEAAGIDYPVVQGEDNEYYLHHTFQREANIAGSIFMDFRNRGFRDEKVILYGHNMRDGSMFAALKNLDLSKNLTAVIYTPEETFQYQILEEEYISPTDEIYQLEESMALHQKEEQSDLPERNLILSTCSNNASRRHILKGILKK